MEPGQVCGVQKEKGREPFTTKGPAQVRCTSADLNCQAALWWCVQQELVVSVQELLSWACSHPCPHNWSDAELPSPPRDGFLQVRAGARKWVRVLCWAQTSARAAEPGPFASTETTLQAKGRGAVPHRHRLWGARLWVHANAKAR